MNTTTRSCLYVNIVYLYITLLLTSCATVDPAVNLEGYREISLQQKLQKANRAFINDDHYLALYWYRIAQSIAPDNEVIRQKTFELQQSLHLQAQQQFDKGLRAKRNGRYTQAKRYLMKALALEPEHPQTLANLKAVDLTIMLTHKGKHYGEHSGKSPTVESDPTATLKPNPVAPWHQQQLLLLQKAARSLQKNQLLGSIALTKRAVSLGDLSLAGIKQVVELYRGLSRAYLNQYNIDLAYQFYRKGKEAYKSRASRLNVATDELGSLLSAQLYQRGREAFPHQISQALYYWEACAYVDKEHRDVDRLLTMARRYKDRLDNLNQEQ